MNEIVCDEKKKNMEGTETGKQKFKNLPKIHTRQKSSKTKIKKEREREESERVLKAEEKQS